MLQRLWRRFVALFGGWGKVREYRIEHYWTQRPLTPEEERRVREYVRGLREILNQRDDA